MKNTGICFAALVILQTVCLAPAWSGDAGGRNFSEQVIRQEKIYESEDEKFLENYIVDRSLQNYTHALSKEFDRTLASLGPKDRWLDIGAGKGQAILDYFTSKYDLTRVNGRERRGGKAQAVAISIEDRRSFLWQQKVAELDTDKIRYLHGRRLEEYAPEELGRFQIISDVVGGFSYALDLSRFVEKTLGILEVNGSFHTLLQDVHSEQEVNQPFYENAPFLTEIAAADGSEVKMCSWLKSISCVQVTCEFKAHWRPPIEVYHIRKTCNDILVPALVPNHYEAGTPPERRYQLAK